MDEKNFHKLTPMSQLILQWQHRKSTTITLIGFLVGTLSGYVINAIKLAIILFVVSQLGFIYGTIFITTFSIIMRLVKQYPKFKTEQKILSKGGK